MSDMWAAASKDIEAERREKATAMAAVALGQFAPFLFEAKTKSEFTTRMALQQTKIAEALQDATEDEDARKAAIDQMTSDFDEALSRREVEAAKAKEEADRKAKVAKALDQRKAKVGHRRQSGRHTHAAFSGPLAALADRLSDLSPRQTIVGDLAIDLGGASIVVSPDRLNFSIWLTDDRIEKELGVVPVTQVAKAEQVVRRELALQGRIDQRAEKELTVGHRRRSTRRTAANEISAGDWISSHEILPDLREGKGFINFLGGRAAKVVKVQNLEQAFGRQWDRYGVVDAARRIEDWLDVSLGDDGRGYGKVWVATLEDGEIVPLDAEGVWSDKFPKRVSEPPIPGQQSFNFAHREAAERLPLRIKMAGEERLPLRIKMANPYSDANPYAQTRQQAPAAPAPQVTVNVAPPNNEGPSTPNNDDEERQRRARDKINQTQMTQDLTASREALAVTLAKKILREHPGATKKQALRVAKATMDRHPALVSHALSRVSSREPKESSPR